MDKKEKEKIKEEKYHKKTKENNKIKEEKHEENKRKS